MEMIPIPRKNAYSVSSRVEAEEEMSLVSKGQPNDRGSRFVDKPGCCLIKDTGGRAMRTAACTVYVLPGGTPNAEAALRASLDVSLGGASMQPHHVLGEQMMG
jgi:hypothetical protein